MINRKIKKIAIVLSCVFFLIFIAFVCTYSSILKGKISITSSVRPMNMYAIIEPVISINDTDHDGIDDQTDIMQNALEYVATKPKYKSKYYSSGYPDDDFGVCTDVVAFAFLNAGMDLQNLVQDDIETRPDDYDIDVPDRNIDFRRVKNLQVYFSSNAQSLTTDINEIEEWQGGDVVIFSHHIGIISDRRNRDGIPYVIHHANPFQLRYEEDILEQHDDIVGHYRVF